jgi:diacylglycerol O-acyltransferase
MLANERAAGHTRANAFSDVYITVDPALATTDLREIRDAVKQALTGPQDLRDEVSAIRSLGLLLPKRLVRVVDSATIVISSNIGVTNPAATRLDRRTPTASPRGLSTWCGQSVDSPFRRSAAVFSGTAPGQVFVSVTAYQPGHTNSNAALRQDLSNALNDSSLTGTYI